MYRNRWTWLHRSDGVYFIQHMYLTIQWYTNETERIDTNIFAYGGPIYPLRRDHASERQRGKHVTQCVRTGLRVSRAWDAAKFLLTDRGVNIDGEKFTSVILSADSAADLHVRQNNL